MSITGWGQLFVTLPVNFDSPIVYHDNYNSENQNYGNTAFLSAFQIPGNQGGVNTSRGLIAFDLSSIPMALEESILDSYQEQQGKGREKLFNYFTRY